ncbi:MAG: AEC family transporter [Caulobacterales bacterium]
MLSVLFVVLPVFALILAGWLARKGNVLGPHATTELNRFVVYLALPALLFDIVANAHWREIWRPDFIATFGLAAAIVFAATVAAAVCLKRRLADAAIDGLNAAYPNTGFMGFPLALAALGPAALAPTLIATILVVCVVFAIALILIQAALHAEQPSRGMALKLTLSLARNPLIFAPALGAVALALGAVIPAPAESFLKLLGGAAPPCALVALGLFLAEPRGGARAAPGAIGALVFLKLIAQPLLTWVLAVHVFHLTPALTHVAVLLAALPTGTGPFMVAQLYQRNAGITSVVVLVSTVVSLVTITLYLHLAL